MGAAQGALTVIVEIAPGRVDPLRALLDGIGDAVEDSPLVPFPRLTTLHFGRWVVLPPQRSAFDDTTYPAQLVLSTSYDGALDAHVAELVHVARDGIDRIYEHCVGYPDADRRAPDRIGDYLKAHAVDPAIFYVGAPGVTARQIHEEAALREDLERFLDSRDRESGGWQGWTPGAVRDAILTYLRARPGFAWALESPGPAVRTLSRLGWIGLVVVAIVLSPVIALGLVLIRVREILEPRRQATGHAPAGGEPRAGPEVSDDQVREVTAREDHQVQNQLSHVVEVKPGLVRWLALRAVMLVLDFGARRVFNQGSLFGVSTLHFVRWVLIDGGRRLLFLTNYDGSLIAYVGDFVNKSWQIPSALTAIWSNTVGFPDTRWLVLDGARDIRRFTAFLREHQVPTQTWYSAYTRLTTGNIVNNARIRRGLTEPLDAGGTAEWLRRL